MLCDNILCTFWSYSKCSLPEISLDEIGQCNEFALIGFELEDAEAARKKALGEIKGADWEFFNRLFGNG